MRKTISLSGFKTVDDVLDYMQEVTDDAYRKLMSDLLARQQDFDDWDQVLAAIEDYRESTAGWREEARAQIEAILVAANRPPDAVT